MIIGYFGNVRQGKTLSAVKELRKFHERGFKIYSNTWLNFEYTPLTLNYLFDIVEQDLSIPDNCVFFIDEMHVWLDSRMSGSKRNRIASYFLLQTGKMGNNTDYGLILLFTSQYPDQIDKRLRHTLDIGVSCEKIIHKNNKYFKLTKYFYKGSKSFNTTKLYKATDEDYKLYDTRKKIMYVKDKYEEEL